MELYESGSAVIGSNGRASVRLQPLRAYEQWHVKRMTVQCTSTVLVPTARVYRGSETPSRQVDGSHTGTMDHTDTDLKLRNTETLICVWEDGDVGANCVFSIEGEKHR